MKSDTPRTDAAILDEHDPVVAVAHTCRQIERELTEANAKIKELTFGWAADREEIQMARERIAELEKAGDRLHDALWGVQDWNGTAVGDADDEWCRAYDGGKS